MIAQVKQTPWSGLALNLNYAESEAAMRDFLRDRVFQSDRLTQEFVDAVKNGQPFPQQVKWKLKIEQEPSQFRRGGGPGPAPAAAAAARPHKTCPHCGKPLPESAAARLAHDLLCG